METPKHTSVHVTASGLCRIPGAKAGDLFLVDSFTPSGDGQGFCAHVIEWKGNNKQIWTLGRGGWAPPLGMWDTMMPWAVARSPLGSR